MTDDSFQNCSVANVQCLLSLLGVVDQVIADDIVLVLANRFLRNEILLAQVRTKEKKREKRG